MSVRASLNISGYVWKSGLARTLALPGQLTAPLAAANWFVQEPGFQCID